MKLVKATKRKLQKKKHVKTPTRKELKRKLLDEEEIPSSEEDAPPDDEEFYDDEFEETANEKRHRLALEYVEQIKSKADNENYEDVDKFVSEKLRQDYLNSRGQLHKKIASQVQEVCLEKTLKGHRKTITCVKASSNQNFLFSSSKDGVIIKFCLVTGKRLKVLKRGTKESDETPVQHFHSVNTLALTYDDNVMVSGDASGLLIVWNAQTCEHIKTLRGHYKGITAIQFQRNTYKLFSCSEDKSIKVWDMKEMAYVESLYGHETSISCVDALTKECCLSVGGQDESMRYWKVVEGSHLVFKCPKDLSMVMDAVAVIDDQHAVTGSQNGSLAVWSFGKRTPLVIVHNAHKEDTERGSCISSVAAARNTDLIASGSHDGYIRLWKCNGNFSSVNLLREIELDGFINWLNFSVDGRYLYAGVGEEHRLGRWWSHPKIKNNVCVFKLW